MSRIVRFIRFKVPSISVTSKLWYIRRSLRSNILPVYPFKEWMLLEIINPSLTQPLFSITY